jgi:hypothetical protein
MQNKLRRGLAEALIAFVAGFGAFLRMPGVENVRNVQIVALLAAGMGLGSVQAHAKLLRGMKSAE